MQIFRANHRVLRHLQQKVRRGFAGQGRGRCVHVQGVLPALLLHAHNGHVAVYGAGIVRPLHARQNFSGAREFPRGIVKTVFLERGLGVLHGLFHVLHGLGPGDLRQKQKATQPQNKTFHRLPLRTVRLNTAADTAKADFRQRRGGENFSPRRCPRNAYLCLSSYKATKGSP